MSDDPARPEIWFLMMLDAMAGLQSGDKAPATAYLRFVEKHRGRQAAEDARASLPRYANSKAFENAAQRAALIRNPPPKVKAAAPAVRRKR